MKLLRTILSNKVFVFTVLFLAFHTYLKSTIQALLFTVAVIVILNSSKYFCVIEPFLNREPFGASLFKTKEERDAFCSTMGEASSKCNNLSKPDKDCDAYNASLKKTNDLLNTLLGKNADY